MRTTFEVDDLKEAAEIREGLRDPVVRSLVKIMGVLRPLPGEARRRVLHYSVDRWGKLPLKLKLTKVE